MTGATGFWLAAVANLLATTSQVYSVNHPECHVIIVRDVTGDLGNRWKAGQVLPVDIARDSLPGGSFCAHGGSCIPRRVGSAQAARLTDCRVGALVDSSDHNLIPAVRSSTK